MKIDIHTHHPSMGIKTLSAIGIHPYDSEGVSPDTLFVIERDIEHYDAIGEIGLDFHHNISRDQQILIFKSQLEIAQKYHKGVVLHCVKAFEPTMEILRNYTLPFVIFHGFIGSAIQATRATKRGYYLSFGHRTFNSPKSMDAMRATPLEQLFLETDESLITIDEIYRQAADVIGMPIPILESIISDNYNRICG